jgi:uncharacterized protein
MRMNVSSLRPKSTLLVLSLMAAPRLALLAQDSPSHPRPDTLAFERHEVMIPMRDSVRLQTVIYRPKGHPEPLPILLQRTPYGVGEELDGLLQEGYGELARDGYVFVFQNVRGRFKSEGVFVMDHPLVDHRKKGATDESTDTYDTIDWLVHQVPNSVPRVGTLGVSYDGWLAAMATIDPHPALQAASPQAVMADLWMGDDDFHQGAFRMSIGLEYESWMQLSRDMSQRYGIDRYDTFDWYRDVGTLDSITKRLRGRVPTWTNFIKHPAYDSFWVNRSLPRQLDSVGGTTVPTLIVGGWWDQEDLYGTIATYDAYERHDSAGRNFIMMGPWYHGSWYGKKTDKLGEVEIGDTTGPKFHEVQRQWFGHWLKDRPMNLPEALLYDFGTRQWRTFPRWPPEKGIERKLHLRANGALSFDPPKAGATAFDQYISDPSHPVPYRRRPIQETYANSGSGWYTWLSQDQRFVDGRPDVLTWQTDTLTEDVTIAGDVIAHLFASTTGSDADWVAKLIDVFPDSMPEPKMGGYELMVTGDIMRGRYRTSNSTPHAIVPKRVAEYTVDMEQQLYTFRKGHRIMVQVQSTWFPLYDRNPQTFVPNIFKARPAHFKARTHRIWRTPARPSHVSVTVLPE